MSTDAQPRPRGMRRYAEVLRIPGLPKALTTALIARLPVGMTALAIVLLVRQQTGSYAIAGAVASAFGLAAGLMAPLFGRWIDRYGITRVVSPLAVVQPVAFAALIVAARDGGSNALLLICGAAVGITAPPMFASMQSLLTRVAEPRGITQTAFAMEAILQELVFLVGPLLVAVIAGVGSPTMALVACAVLTLVGSLSFALLTIARDFEPKPTEHTRLIGALSSPAIRTFAFVGLASGYVFGTLEVAMPAFAGEHASPSAGGILLGIVAAGSMLGGLWHGARAHVNSQSNRYVEYLALFALALYPLALPTSFAVMAPLALIAGFFIAPGFATELGLVGLLAPAGKTTEAFTWISMAVVVGISIGNAVSGVIAQHGSASTALLVAAASATIAAAIAFLRRSTFSSGKPG